METTEVSLRVANHSDSAVNGDRPMMSATHTGAVKVAQIDPPYAALCRGGHLYAYSTAGGTAKAPVSAIGTTTAAFALWNGNAAGSGYNIEVVDAVAFLVSGTAPVGSTAIAGLSSAAQASAVSAYSGVVGPKALNASTARTSQAIIGGAITLAGAPVWVQIGTSHVAQAVGGSILCPINGKIVIPPQYACGFTIVSDTGSTPLWGWTFTYVESISALG